MFYQPAPEGYRELLPGVTMKPLSYSDKTMLCEFKLAKGALIPAHHHLHEQTGYLVQGSIRLFGAAGEFIATPGCSWSFQGDLIHGAEALEDSILIEVFSPLRQEYLPAV